MIRESIYALSPRGRNKRLYFEGDRLSAIHLTPGRSFSLRYDKRRRTLMLELSETGTHHVTHKFIRGEQKPAIDLANAELTAFFGDVKRVRARFEAGRIVVMLTRSDLRRTERFERLVRRLRSGKPLRTLSIAHGGGILDWALHDGLKMGGVDARLEAAIERERRYMESSMVNTPLWGPYTRGFECPMQEVDPADLPEVDLLAGGIPCTGASQLGRTARKLKNAEAHPEAGTLVLDFLAFVDACNPAIVVLENVPEYQKSVSMQLVRQRLTERGYAVHESILDGHALGSLERRKRLCMVAVTEGITFDFAELQPVRQAEPCLSLVLDPVPPTSPLWRSFPYLVKGEAKNRAAGRGFCNRLKDGTESFVQTISRGYNMVRLHEPRLAHPSDPELMRQFTPAEHARIKTTPEQAIAGLPLTTAHEILGQSVIFCAFVAVGRLIALALRDLLRPAGAGRQLELALA